MQTPQELKNSDRLYDQSLKEAESYNNWASYPNQDQPHSCSEDGGAHFFNHTPYDQYPMLELSSTNGALSIYDNSPSTFSFSPNDSPESQLEFQSSCVTDNVQDLNYKIKELETAMLGTNSDNLDELYDITKQIQPQNEKYNQMMEIVSRWDVKEVLIACAKAVSDNDLITVEWLMNQLQSMVSVSGEPIQRLGAYMLEGLVARFAASGSFIYKALRCKEPASAELFSYMHVLYEICPYFKFGYMSANGAIAEAMKNENNIHIIDFQIAQGSQWFTLIQALAARPGGPPRIRITGIDDSTSAYARGGGLDIVGKRLSMLAKSCNVPFEFNGTALSGSEVGPECLQVRPGEALAVNFAFMLHHMPDENVGPENHRDRLLRLVKSLSPKVVTLVEQESNTNTALFLPRFIETIDYYTAIFESIDVTLPRDHKERMNVEQHCLARDVVNIIACEGIERVERHELLGKWTERFLTAGFTPYPLSSLVNATIKTLLENYSDKYGLEEKDGVLYLGWMNRALVASCAWR